MEPLVVPDEFWGRQEVHDALAARDFGALFRLLGKYVGASQTRIAIAVGMTQGQVSAFMAGGRRVTAIEVAERALDGLGAPDRARLAFGLAPWRTQGWEVRHSPGLPRPRRADTGSRPGAEAATEDDVNRRDALRLSGSTVLAAAVGIDAGVVDRFAKLARVLTPYDALILSDTLSSSPLSTLADLGVAVADAKRAYQACRYSTLLEALPGLLDSVRHACSVMAGDQAVWAATSFPDRGSTKILFRKVRKLCPRSVGIIPRSIAPRP